MRKHLIHNLMREQRSNMVMEQSSPGASETTVFNWLKELLDKGAAPTRRAIEMAARFAGASESDVIRACSRTADAIDTIVLPTARKLKPDDAEQHYYLTEFACWCRGFVAGEPGDRGVRTFRQMALPNQARVSR